MIKDREEGEDEDVITEIDSFTLTKKTGENEIKYTGKNTTNVFQYIVGFIPSVVCLAAYTFGKWFPTFIGMVPKLVYIYAVKDIF